MSIDPRLISLIVRYEDLCAEGQPASPEELCRDCPELLEVFWQHLGLVLAMDAVLQSRSARGVSSLRLHRVEPETEQVPHVETQHVYEACPPSCLPSPSPDVTTTYIERHLSVSSISSPPGYKILSELGRGGMGVVYLARQVRANRLVALKMILAGAHASKDQLKRFQTEAEAVARLQHPNIVQVFEVGEHEGLPFFSLEYCPGGSLARKLNGTPLAAMKAAELVKVLAWAMTAAHERQVIHRDLKPANVLLLADGTPKIGDFGLAKRLDEVGDTRSGDVMGSPSYMAQPFQHGQTASMINKYSEFTFAQALFCSA